MTIVDFIKNMDLPIVRDFVIELSKKAGKTLEHYFKSQNFHQEAKGEIGDVLTKADTEVDDFIRKHLAEKFPNAHLMTEETTSGDYRYLKSTDWVFIVDPLDGTINFTRNNPHFGIAIGLVHKGQMKLCVAHLPMKGETYWADDATEGAFLNGEEIHVSSITQPNQMVIGCDWSNNKVARRNMLAILEELTPQTRRIKCQGSPVADLCLVAKGDFDAYIHTRLRPWDITPAYIVQKAGGTVTNFQESAWDIFRLDLLATNSKLHSELSKHIHFESSLEIK